MRDVLIMSKKERQRKAVLEQLLANTINHCDAAKRLQLSRRQLKRVVSRYVALGDVGLVHRSRGKPSGHAFSETIKRTVMALYQEKYVDFGPTLASEKLCEDEGIAVHAETLRLWLKSEGLWHRKRKHNPHRTRRARRARFGELLQLDGSIHCWFMESDKKQCLMNMVDDATGKTLALLDTGETTFAAFALLRWWIQEAGIPLAIYVDLKSLYVSPKYLHYTEEDELVEPEWLTHFSKACKKLGIEVIRAHSPQAKGRVERKHAVYQDRFVKELKLKNITTLDKANALLSGGFINKLNEKFAKPPLSTDDAHMPLPPTLDLNQIFCWEYERVIKNDWTIQLKSQHYQIEYSRLVPTVRPRQKVIFRRHMDNSLSLWKGDIPLPFHPIEDAPVNLTPPRKISSWALSQIKAKNARATKYKSPWGDNYIHWLKAQRQTPDSVPPAHDSVS